MYGRIAQTPLTCSLAARRRCKSVTLSRALLWFIAGVLCVRPVTKLLSRTMLENSTVALTYTTSNASWQLIHSLLCRLLHQCCFSSIVLLFGLLSSFVTDLADSMPVMHYIKFMFQQNQCFWAARAPELLTVNLHCCTQSLEIENWFSGKHFRDED